MARSWKRPVSIALGFVFLWACADVFVAGAANARQAEVHEVKITEQLTFSPLVLQMRSGDKIRFCDKSGLYILPYYFPWDGLHAPPNDLVRLGTVPAHQCMTTDPITLPQDSRGKRFAIFSEIQQGLKLIVGLHPDEPGPVPPLLNDPFSVEPILGSWKSCSRIVKFSKEGDTIVGRYIEVADLSEYGFQKNDVSHRLSRSAVDKYSGIVVWKYVEETADGKKFTDDQKPTVITVRGDRANDVGADSCGRTLTRIPTQ